ncbi:MAG: AI-2E family transporter [Nanoarchaeota archaeon]|nr:AI-2E family transporter [Nanoarchaeota archaeon]
MAITEKDIKRISVILFIALLAVLVFLILRPVLLAVIGGLILAYIFFPIYKKILQWVKYKSLAAALVSIFVLALILVPIWFLTPMMSQQVFEIFKFSQEFDINSLARSIFPSASEQFLAQVHISFTNALSKITSSILNSLVDFLLNFLVISLQILLVAFVFFFTLKDESKLREFVSGLSPLSRIQEAHLVKQFKDITQSIIYGQIVGGLIQGVFAGLGFLIFGIPNALILTVVAVILSVIPVIGPGFIYIPVGIYLLIIGKQLLAIGFLLFNLIIVSSIDSVLRAHWVSKKTRTSQAVMLVGMLGGFFIFGILGLIIGPLVLAYFITFLRAYKERTLSSLFSEN